MSLGHLLLAYSFLGRHFTLYCVAYLPKLYILFPAPIDVLVKGKGFVESYMNGNPWKAGKFSLSLSYLLLVY